MPFVRFGEAELHEARSTARVPTNSVEEFRILVVVSDPIGSSVTENVPAMSMEVA
jgi:hypothetical protein